jgi:hypothetical protein
MLRLSTQPQEPRNANLPFATVIGVSSSSRMLAAVWVGVVVLGLSACGGDDEPAGEGSPSPSSSSTTPSGSEDPTPSQSPPQSESVAPATGVELREQTSSIRAPEGWRAAPPLASYQSGAIGPGGAGTINLIDDETLNPGTPFDERVQAAIKTLPDGADYTRLPDVMLGDSLAYHLTWTTPGRSEVSDVIETERNGRLITINTTLSAKAVKQDPDLVASVLATFQWVG